jgi:ribosome-associated protein
MKKTTVDPEDKLLDVIVESIKEKKGKEIVTIDLRKTGSSICDYFVICHGDSKTQAGAIAESVTIKTKEDLGIRVSHVEGEDNGQWVLLDYMNIVVHIFQPEYRSFYRLEDLWADGILTKYEENY